MASETRPAVDAALADLRDTDDYTDDQLQHIAELLNDAYNAGHESANAAHQARCLGHSLCWRDRISEEGPTDE